MVVNGFGTTRTTAVLFDMGGTLFDYRDRGRMRQPVRDALVRMGLSLDDPHVLEAWTRARADVEVRYARLPAFLHRDLFRDRVIETAMLLDVEADPDVLAAFDTEQRDSIVDALVARADAADMLRALRASGRYVAVVSNADDDYVEPVLRAGGLADLLDDWTSSQEAWSCKPDPGIFRLALDKAARTAEETVFVGDSPQHDVAGAAAVGMATILIRTHDDPAPLSADLPPGPEPDAVVRTLAEIPALLDGGTPRP